MSNSGAIFQFFANNGKQDQILRRTDAFNNLMSSVHTQLDTAAASKSQSFASYEPALSYVAKKFFVPIYRVYKPFMQVYNQYLTNHQKSGKPNFGARTTFTLAQVGHFISDCYLQLTMSSFEADNRLQDKVRWVTFPGARIMKETRFLVNGNELDKYYAEDYIRYYNFNVGADKKDSWKRCMGEQIPYTATLVPDPRVDQFVELRRFAEGPQTFKQTQDLLRLTIPLLFWFRKTSCAFPNGSVNHGQVNIECNLEEVENMIALGNISGTGSINTPPKILDATLIVNHLYVDMSIISLYVGRYATTMARIHLHTTKVLNTGSDRIWLNDLKFPVEVMYFGFRPQANAQSSQTWNQFSELTLREVDQAVISNFPLPTSNNLVINVAQYNVPRPVVDRIGFRSNDLVLLDEVNIDVLSHASHFRDGNMNLVSPEDPGWYVYGFNQSTADNPSGHINLSKQREFYLDYHSETITPTNPATLLMFATAIAFVLYSDNSASLRYST
jgi:hypothetical protein